MKYLLLPATALIILAASCSKDKKSSTTNNTFNNVFPSIDTATLMSDHGIAGATPIHDYIQFTGSDGSFVLHYVLGAPTYLAQQFKFEITDTPGYRVYAGNIFFAGTDSLLTTGTLGIYFNSGDARYYCRFDIEAKDPIEASTFIDSL